LTGFAGRLFDDYTAQLAFPLRLARTDAPRFLVGFGGVATLILTDPATYDALVPPSARGRDDFVKPATALSKLGGTRSALPLVVGIGALGVLAGSDREKQTAVMLTEALVTSATWTSLLKSTTGRERPREREARVSDWAGPAFFDQDDGERAVGFRSFPSGHATGAWAAVTVLAHQYPERRIVPVAGYTLAAAISYSRMVLGAHWLSDVVVGGLIGYGSAKQVLSAHGADSARTSEGPRFQIGVSVSDDYRGLGFTYRF
jgi:membrane-associated phospholipid phosphatase